MPKRDDIKSILILGSGPIVIGQACEFDYSSTQACKVLRKEGYRIILHNSNPATIMTDPDLADATYIEPLIADMTEKIIAKERPDVVLPTVGGQTALNLSIDLDKRGTFSKYNVELLGASVEAINRAESRQQFKACMEEIGLQVPKSRLCHNMSEAEAFLKEKGLPLIIRPSFTLGGTGGGIARNYEDFTTITLAGLTASPTNEILIEESVLGWKEFELEVMRDQADNVVIICSIENLDPMGVHTGDSITVAPQQTLSDRQYQNMRNAALAIIRKIGVTTGGSNIQFAVNPENGDMVVIEMNPRVSRSSALASKATGFPIAKIAAQLAVGYTLDELKNEITRVTPCSFEPSIDYVVVKAPRFAFEKFPESEDTLDTMMRSVGESMSLGRTFKESLQKSLRSLEISRFGLGADGFLGELFSQYEALPAKQKESSKQTITQGYEQRSKQVVAQGYELRSHTADEANNQNDTEDRTAYYKQLRDSLIRPHPYRIFSVKKALVCGLLDEKSGFSVQEVASLSGIDPWFLYQILELAQLELEYQDKDCPQDPASLRKLKQNGYSDRQIAFLSHQRKIQKIVCQSKASARQQVLPMGIFRAYTEIPEYVRRNQVLQLLQRADAEIKEKRYSYGIFPVYKRVDTCAAEFESYTPYLYSTYEEEDEAAVTTKPKVLILGGGPNRIGQGIEFDYCCCHASFALQDMDIEAIMVNSNPETVSTDYDISTKLYFEPLTLEDVLHICRHEKPDGVIVSFGGQTPLSLAKELAKAGVRILGTSPDAIDRAEDRDRFSELLKKLGLQQAHGGMAYNTEEAIVITQKIGYPVLVRPSYVLGGRAMVIVYSEKELDNFMEKAASISPEHPVLIDRFLENAIEIDVDALADGEEVFVAGIMQHIEEAGVHSGDSACVLPPIDLSSSMVQAIEEATRKIALELGVVGLLNIQFAIYQDELFVIEVNPRASRTIPFVSKAIGLPLPSFATQIVCGKKIKHLIIKENISKSKIIAVKEAVLPFARFAGSDIILGPEMKSTGEVMGIASSLGEAYIKAQLATGEKVPQQGNIFFSISNEAKELLLEEARILGSLGYVLYGTQGTANLLKSKGIAVQIVHKMRENKNPNPLAMVQEGRIQAVINIPHSHKTRDDAFVIRQEAVRRRLLCVTTVAGTKALVHGLQEMKKRSFEVASLQSIHA